jgi:hypothetical protein
MVAGNFYLSIATRPIIANLLHTIEKPSEKENNLNFEPMAVLNLLALHYK